MMHSRATWKGCHLAYEAVRRAQTVIPNLQLITFGMFYPDEPLPPGGTFVHAPDQAELRSLYQRCDAWLFCSRVEGFGLPLLEAMACRTPVIGTPAGAAPELLADGAGRLVPFDDLDALTQAIIDMAQLPEADWQILSERAYERATQYTWQDAVVKFEAALDHAMARSQSGTLQPMTAQEPGQF